MQGVGDAVIQGRQRFWETSLRRWTRNKRKHNLRHARRRNGPERWIPLFKVWRAAAERANSMKKKFTIRVILFAVALGVIGWWMLRSDEPSYKGKSLSYWVDPWNQGGNETEAARSAALAAMRERGYSISGGEAALETLADHTKIIQAVSQFPAVHIVYARRLGPERSCRPRVRRIRPSRDERHR